MRTFIVLRALAVAAVLSAPLTQALAGQPEQQSMSQSDNGYAGSFDRGGPYGNNALISPAVGS